MSDREPSIFIEHILSNIRDIENFSKGMDKMGLKKSILKQKAITRSIEIIGEAVNNLPDEFKGKYQEVPWRDIVGMRNKLIHHYFGVDLEIVWKTIKEEIPYLKQKILKIKKDLESESRKEK